MKGALLELAARGAQDINIIGNPQMSFFKAVHRRHTNFSRFESNQIFNGGYGFGQKCVMTLEKRGDLLYRTMLVVKLPYTGNNDVSWINAIGNFMIKTATLKIGGEQICQMTGDYLDIYHRYSLELGHYSNYCSMVGRVTGFRQNTQPGPLTLFIPLPFWFCREFSQALPMISLGYMDVTLEIEFRHLEECLYSAGLRANLGTLVDLPSLNISSCSVLSEYIYLDKYERTLFATKPDINYLIEQTFTMEFGVDTNDQSRNYSLVFSNPVKELLWFYRSKYWEDRNRWDVYTVKIGPDEFAALDTAGLLFNGLDRVSVMDADYFRLVQPLYHHSGSGSGYVYFYSFSERVNKLQPMGAANFSCIDDARLLVNWKQYVTEGNLYVMAVNYNFLKIKKGMAGILYSS